MTVGIATSRHREQFTKRTLAITMSRGWPEAPARFTSDPKKAPRHVSPTKLAEELADAGKAAISNCCLWPSTLAAQSSLW